MRLKNTIFYAISAALLLCGCSKEVPVTNPRDISAEFPSDPSEPRQAGLVFLDGIDTPLTGQKITKAAQDYAPEIFFFTTGGTIDGKPIAEFLESNRSSWGHDKSFTAGGNGCSTSLPVVSSGPMSIYVSEGVTETFLTLTTSGYNFVCGNVRSEDSICKDGKDALMQKTVIADGNARWVVVCHAWWTGSTPWKIAQCYWPGYGYNEVVFAKFGKDCLPQRKELTFVSENLLNSVSDTQATPLRFDFDIIEED